MSSQSRVVSKKSQDDLNDPCGIIQLVPQLHITKGPSYNLVNGEIGI